MNFWLLLWFFISAVLIGFMIWTSWILFMQKKNWRLFASANKLRYTSKTLMGSPEVHGVYNGYPVSVFTSEHAVADGRSERKMTAIEVEMDSRMPVGGAMGSKGMVAIIQSLNYSDTYQPSSPEWNVENIIRCDDKKVLESYLTDERLSVLCQFLDQKRTWGLFIFQGNDTILRIDTPDPLEGVKELQNTIDSMIELARHLELKKGEDKSLLAYSTQRAATRGQRIEVDEKKLEGNKLSLELEVEDDAVEDVVLTDEPVAVATKE